VTSLKFQEPYTVETTACRHAILARLACLWINKKSHAIQVDAVRSYSDFTEGNLDFGSTVARWEPTTSKQAMEK
jgi:hypothetical protein